MVPPLELQRFCTLTFMNLMYASKDRYLSFDMLKKFKQMCTHVGVTIMYSNVLFTFIVARQASISIVLTC